MSAPRAGGWRLELGARVEPGAVHFSAWAPRAKTLAVELVSEGRRVAMERGGDDVFRARVAGVGAGADYRLVLDGQDALPDPVSRWQPHGVHGPSRVVDPAAFAWSAPAGRRPTLEDYVLYELHVGTFTPQGTFDAAIEKLPHLVALGVTAVELMPVAEFPGARNWGYDGVHLFAPHSAYGGPEGLKRLVDACHRLGLAAVLDVVYNHLGPEGNYLARFGPYFTDRYRTPWGEAINFDGPDSDGVRRHFVDNARYWLDEFHFDALRLDAVHGIVDQGARHILRDLAEAADAQAAQRERPAYLIAESDLNDVRLLEPPARGGYGLHAQWSDDFHHALHAALTGTRKGYFADYGAPGDLRKAVAEGFVYDGRYSAFRRRRHGNSSAGVEGQRLVICTQNHDQVANGSGGDRAGRLLGLEAQKLSLALLACAPYVPLLFMGQEWGETAPFHFFTSFGDPALAAAVKAGRAQEFLAFDWAAKITDPQAPETFASSKLNWALAATAPHAQLLSCVTDLLALRRTLPALGARGKDLAQVAGDDAGRWLQLRRRAPGAAEVACLFNLGPGPAGQPFDASGGEWSLALGTAAARYGGSPEVAGPPQVLRGAADVVLPPSSAAIYVRAATA